MHQHAAPHDRDRHILAVATKTAKCKGWLYDGFLCSRPTCLASGPGCANFLARLSCRDRFVRATRASTLRADLTRSCLLRHRHDLHRSAVKFRITGAADSRPARTLVVAGWRERSEPVVESVVEASFVAE